MPPTFVPPPPLPPAFYLPPRAQSLTPHNTDQDFVKSFEANLLAKEKRKKSSLSICEVRNELRNMVLIVNNIKSKHQSLSNNMGSMSEEEWKSITEQIDKDKETVKEYLVKINNLNVDVLRKLIEKRTAKRMRLKRLRLERRREKEDMIKQAAEKSRKIDENLQKIKDDINKIKQVCSHIM